MGSFSVHMIRMIAMRFVVAPNGTFAALNGLRWLSV